jgi:hypothetical protein
MLAKAPQGTQQSPKQREQKTRGAAKRLVVTVRHQGHVSVLIVVKCIIAILEKFIGMNLYSEHKSGDPNAKGQYLHGQKRPIIVCSRGYVSGDDDPNEG